MNKIKYFFICSLMFHFLAYGCSQNAKDRNESLTISSAELQNAKKISIEGLKQSLESSDYSKLNPFLSNLYTAGSYSGESVHQVIPKILAKHPKLMSLEVKQETGDSTMLKLIFEQMITRSSNITFDKNGKITRISFFDELLEQWLKAETTKFEKVLSFEAPFELVGEGLIMVKVKLNGVEEDFILDSGAPAVIINTNQKDEMKTAKGVAGEMDISDIVIKSFDWNGIRTVNTTFIGIDLSHLEKEIGKPFKGLIGFNAIKDYILYVDYSTKTLFLTSNIADIKNIQRTFPFEYQGHIPTIEIEISNKSYKIGLDTGAESNLLDISHYDKLPKSNLKLIEQTDLIGADGKRIFVDYFLIKNLHINKKTFSNMEFVASDISHLNEGYRIELAGLLGYPFLKRKIAIDFINQQIYLLK